MSKIIGNTTATPNPRPDWNQTDETKADFIKNKPAILDLDIIPSEGEESIVGNDITSNKAISTHSTALGSGTIAGSKGFRIKDSHNNGDGTGTYTLEGYDGGYEADEENGDEYSLRISSNYDLRGKITNIVGTTITVDNFVDVQLVTGDVSGDLNTFRVPSKPHIGNINIGSCATAFGMNTKAVGICSYAEGGSTLAHGKYSHAEGVGTSASYAAHAEGRSTKATGQTSHAEGTQTEAKGGSSHAEGEGTLARGVRSHAEGSGLVENNVVIKPLEAYGMASHAEGNVTLAYGTASHAEGDQTEARGYASHAEGKKATASGNNSHAEGSSTTASGGDSHAEGGSSTASGSASHAEGYGTTASGSNSHAEGNCTTASKWTSHAEGASSTASGQASHAEGSSTTASGNSSHAEGNKTVASGYTSHAEGNVTTAMGEHSHAEGERTIATERHQHVQGRYNYVEFNEDGTIKTSGKNYAHIVGGGTSDKDRKNIHTLDWDGNAWFAGNVQCAGSAQFAGNVDAPNVNAFEGEIRNNTKRIKNLEEGLVDSLFITNSEATYLKAVPANACPYAQVLRVGGMTSYTGNMLPYPYHIQESQSGYYSVTENADHSITINGRGAEQENGIDYYSVAYTISANYQGHIQSGRQLGVAIFFDDENYIYAKDDHSSIKHATAYDTIVECHSLTMSYNNGISHVEFKIHLVGTIWNLTIYPMIYDSGVGLIKQPVPKEYIPWNGAISLQHNAVTQIVSGGSTIDIPYENVDRLKDYGVGISDGVCNYIEFHPSDGTEPSTANYVQMCSIRDYKNGDEKLSGALTDLSKTVVRLQTPVRSDITDILPISNFFMKVSGAYRIMFVNEYNKNIPNTVMYQLKEG